MQYCIALLASKLKLKYIHFFISMKCNNYICLVLGNRFILIQMICVICSKMNLESDVTKTKHFFVYHLFVMRDPFLKESISDIIVRKMMKRKYMERKKDYSRMSMTWNSIMVNNIVPLNSIMELYF